MFHLQLFRVLFFYCLCCISFSHVLYQEKVDPVKVNNGIASYTMGEAGFVITQISTNETIQFNKSIDSGIALSGFLTTGKITYSSEKLKKCVIAYSNDTTKVIYDFYQLFTQIGSHTKIFNNSITLTCINSNVTEYGFVLQRASVLPSGGYAIHNLFDNAVTIGSIEVLSAFTLVSLVPAKPIIIKSIIEQGSSYKIGTSTPQKAPNFTISNQTQIPLLIETDNYLFTTFYFENVIVDLDVKAHYSACDGVTTIKQSELKNNSFLFPFIDLIGQYDCTWKIEALNSDYIPKISVAGLINPNSNSTFNINFNNSDNYYGYSFTSSENIPRALTGIYYPPQPPSIIYKSSMTGFTKLGFKVEFIKIDISKPSKTFEVSNDLMIDSTMILPGETYRFQSKDMNNNRLILSVALSSLRVDDLNKCLVITQDNNVYNTYTLQESYRFAKPIIYTSFTLQCFDNISAAYKLVATSAPKDNLDKVCGITSRYAVLQATATLSANLNCDYYYITFILANNIDNLKLVKIDPNDDNTVIKVRNGTMIGEVVQNITNKTPLPVISYGKYLTYQTSSHSLLKMAWNNTFHHTYVESTTTSGTFANTINLTGLLLIIINIFNIY